MSFLGRSKHRRTTTAAALLAVSALLLTACGGSDDGGDDDNNTSDISQAPSFNAAVDQVFRPTSEPTGGTLNVGIARDCDYWDPARTYYGYCWNLQRLFTRGLMAFKPEPGPAGNEVTPDLATGPGESNDDFTEWTYTLRDGLKWDDGSPLTSADVKYGISRSFATDVITGGPTYVNCLLTECDDEGASPYKGPYAKSGAQLDSIQTPDDKTIVFSLVEPYANWDYLMAMPATAPVPESRDTRGRYTRNPASSGPFKVAEYNPNQSIRFVRNENWSQDTDEVRRPLVDEVSVTMFTEAKDLDQRLEQGTIDAPGDGPVQTAFQGRIASSEQLKAQADNPVTAYSRMLILSPAVAPFDNVHCRRAVHYAVSKSDLLRARGGQYGGQIANSVTPVDFPGHDPELNPYPNGAENDGDLDKARQELQECGQPDGFSTKMAYPSGDERNRNIFAAVQRALDRVGIKVSPAPGSGNSYFSTYIGSQRTVKDQGLGIQVANWAADFPQPLGFWYSIADGSQIKQVGNTNWGLLDDPEINDAIASMRRTTDQDEQNQLGTTVDENVMEEAVYLPYVYDKVLFFRGERMVNVYVLLGTGGWYDFVNMGVQE